MDIAEHCNIIASDVSQDQVLSIIKSGFCVTKKSISELD